MPFRARCLPGKMSLRTRIDSLPGPERSGGTLPHGLLRDGTLSATSGDGPASTIHLRLSSPGRRWSAATATS